MISALATTNHGDKTFAHSILLRERVSALCRLTNYLSLFLADFKRISTTLVSVAIVICFSTCIEMARIAARRIITSMQAARARPESVCQKEGYGVSTPNSSVETKPTVALMVRSSCPWVTSVWSSRLVDFRPEPIFHVCHSILQAHIGGE